VSKNIVIVDNFLEDSSFKSIYDLMMNDNFPWYYNNYVVFPNDNHFQFTHVFFADNKVNSNYYNNFIVPYFLDRLNAFAVHAIKANLKLQTNEIVKYQLHTDYSYEDSGVENEITAIYYVNSNNGFTFFEDGTKIDSIENRLILFDGRIKHAGTSCTDQKTRCVINFNYVGKLPNNPF
jgi:hypothetical protein